ncbi:hypothetical protein C8R45DRAFT_932925 [Mycena sanguinolenta]|nr:hypothetical protein C8R45DRAFT_932925 [Mycena sanguinolenta]
MANQGSTILLPGQDLPTRLPNRTAEAIEMMPVTQVAIHPSLAANSQIRDITLRCSETLLSRKKSAIKEGEGGRALDSDSEKSGSPEAGKTEMVPSTGQAIYSWQMQDKSRKLSI